MNDTDPGTISVTHPTAFGPAPADTAGTSEPELDVPSADKPATETGSPLGKLAAVRARMVETLYTDLRVPRWGDPGTGAPQLFVRYEPANLQAHSERMEKAQKQHKKPADWAVKLNAQVLVDACKGVYAVEVDDATGEPDEDADKLSLREGDPYGAWTRFDPELADALGLDHNAGAIGVVRGLYLTEPDIIATVNKLFEWSGVEIPRANRDFSGG